jgi:hypothetical protein
MPMANAGDHILSPRRCFQQRSDMEDAAIANSAHRIRFSPGDNTRGWGEAPELHDDASKEEDDAQRRRRRRHRHKSCRTFVRIAGYQTTLPRAADNPRLPESSSTLPSVVRPRVPPPPQEETAGAQVATQHTRATPPGRRAASAPAQGMQPRAVSARRRPRPA